MKLSAEHKKLIIGLLIGSLSTLIGGFLLIQYEYIFLKDNTNYGSPKVLSPWRENRSITVGPISKWSQSVLFNPRRYYKVFEIEFNSGDVGFPPNTAVQITASMGKIIRIIGPEVIKPTLAGGISATDWTDKKHKDSIKTVFISGPNAGIIASLRVVVISIGKEPADDSLKLIVSPPGEKPLTVDYKTDIKWTTSK